MLAICWAPFVVSTASLTMSSAGKSCAAGHLSSMLASWQSSQDKGELLLEAAAFTLHQQTIHSSMTDWPCCAAEQFGGMLLD